MEDAAHDIFIIAYENLHTFRGESSLKTWVFTIATNHARKLLKANKPWYTDTFNRTKNKAHQEKDVMDALHHAHQSSPQGAFEIREHIGYCFICVSKMLPLDQQVSLILKDIYEFKVKEISEIMNISHGSVKHLLYNSRRKMIHIFSDTCALVSKKGVCDQCSGLNGRFNPKENIQEQLMKIKMIKEKDSQNTKKLYQLRTELVKSIDPLHANGTDLHETFMDINHKVNS